jgi:hypothetical protein
MIADAHSTAAFLYGPRSLGGFASSIIAQRLSIESSSSQIPAAIADAQGFVLAAEIVMEKVESQRHAMPVDLL